MIRLSQKMCVPPPQAKPSSGSLRGIKHSYCPSAMNLGKNGIKLLLCKAKSLSFTFHCFLSFFAMLSFIIHYFPIKNTSCSKQKDEGQVPPDKTQSPVWQQGSNRAVLECWWLEARHRLRLVLEMQCASSQPVVNLHLALSVLEKSCFLCW